MRTILLADNEYIIREGLKILVNEIKDVSVVGEASTGRMAVEIFIKSNPDMVILDIHTPGIPIEQLIHQLRVMKENPCIILLMGIESQDRLKTVAASGADGFIAKPFNRDKIITIINHFLPIQTITNGQLERTVEQFIFFVNRGDFSSTKEVLKQLTGELLSHYGNNQQLIRSKALSLIDRLKSISQEKGFSSYQKSRWSEKGRNIDISSLEHTISSIIEEMFNEKMKSSSQGTKEIQLALNFIEKHYHRGITLEEVADYVHLSPFYLSKLFKKELQVNFVSYVIERKVEKAKELLLDTDMPVLNIALELNYQEPNYFSKVFKKVTGMTPSEFRKGKEGEKEKTKLTKKHHQVQNGKWYV